MEITDGDLREFRERAKTELKSGCDCGRMRWDDVVEALCEEVARLRDEPSAANADSAAMREALSTVKELFDGRIMFQPAIREAHKAVIAALAKPPRNCDRFKTKEEAAIAFADETKQWIPQQVLWELAPWLDWLFATSKKGESK